MNVEDAEEYTQSLGQIVSGGWRQILLAQRLGVPQTLGMSTREWVEERLGGYVRLNAVERKEAVKELVAEGLSQRQVADVLGVNAGTVNRDTKPVANATLKQNLEPESVANATPAKPGLAVVPDPPKPKSKRALAAEQREREVAEQRGRRADRLRSFIAGMPEFYWYANPPDDDSRAIEERAAVLALLTAHDQQRITHYVESLDTEKLEVPE
jgi:transcriptional regulator with XRE-family HTH domain